MSAELFELGFSLDTRPLEKGERKLDAFSRSGEKAENSLSKTKAAAVALTGVVATLVGSLAVNEVIRYSDAWTQVDNQLRGVIDSESELITKRQQLLALSNETRSALDSTVSLYAELYRGTRMLGTSEEEVINVTRTLNNLFLAGGKKADEQAGAIRQLSQALGAGALRGDEFNSVAEGAPRILDALSQHLNISKGELRDFAATGGITAEILVDALGKYESQAQAMADRTTATWEQNEQVIHNNVTSYIGASETLMAATASLSSGLVSLSENIDSVVAAAQAGAVVFGAYALVVGGKSVAAMAGNALSTARSTKEKALQAAATEKQISAEFRLLQLQQRSLSGQLALAKSERTRSSIRGQLAANTTALAATESKLATAQTAAAATGRAATTSSIALTGAARALGTAVNFLLGPWGLLLTGVGIAAATFMQSKNAADLLNESLDKQKTQVNKLIDGYQDLNEQGIKNLITNLNNEMTSIRQQIIQTQATITAQQRMMSSLDPSGRVDARKTISDAELQLESLRGQLDLVSKAQQDIFNFRMPKNWINMDDAADGVQKLSSKALDQLSELKRLQMSVGMTSDELFVFQQVQRSIANKDAPSVTAKIREQADAYIWLKNKIESKVSYQGWISGIQDAITQAEKLEHEIAEVWLAIFAGDLDEKSESVKRYLKDLEDQLENINSKSSGFDKLASGASSFLSSIQRLSTEGTDAYQKLERAIHAVNLAQSLATGNIAGAIGSGVSLLLSFDKDIKDMSAEIQANQNLNVWGEKSEAISRSVDITASATEKLVGINTKMLSALQSVQSGIIGASGIIAKQSGAPQVNASGLGISSNVLTSNIVGDTLMKGMDLFNKLTFNLLGGLGNTLINQVGKLLGGSSKVTDEGIKIIGGSITDLIDDVTVQAFQTVKYKKWRFGSTKRKTAIKDLGDSASSQFALVFDSILNSVVVGAETLGISSSEIEKAIEAFNISTSTISMKGLNQEQRQKELEAYFSRVFNGLSSSVIPFLSDFQIAGEELGETLSRVATQVSIMEFAADRLGITISSKMSDPKAFAIAADNITMLVGGVEQFAEKTGSFVNSFASDTTKIGIYQDSLSKSLAEVGLKLPKTASGMWDLMSGLNASTEAGQAQIAALLNLTEESSAYYNLLESASNRYREAALGIYEVTEATRQVGLDAALASARMGDMSLAENLDLSSISPQASDFASLFDFQMAQADTSRKLLELADITEGQLTVEDKQLAELQKIRESLSGESGSANEEQNNAINELKKEIENMSRNFGIANAETNENLDRIANGVTTVRIEA